jgi:drug/metabolite transporter (DMT)-like permease
MQVRSRAEDAMQDEAFREPGRDGARRRAILTALFVTFLWSTSWVLIRWGLEEIAPLTFAGLRYSLAFLCLAPVLWTRRAEVRAISPRGWAVLISLGLLLYALTQGGQFLALTQLSATTLALCLSMTAALVALVGVATKREPPRALQWLGIGTAVAGALAYFASQGAASGTPLGFAFAGLTVAANAAASLLGRRVNRGRVASPAVLTALSMGFGGAALLVLGLAIEGVPRLSARSWGLIGWLAVVNTALAFTLWNRTLRTLTAAESSVLNNTMLVQVAALAWIFLGETSGPIEVVGLALVVAGTVLVQRRRVPD